jgi:hypothetical protein
MKTTFGIYIAVAFFLNSGGLLYGAPTDASPKDSAVPPPTVCAQLNCETIFWEKWLTHLVFGFDGQ